MPTKKRTAPHVYAFIAVGVIAMGAVGAGTNACTPAQREGARTAIDGFNFACVIANQLLADARIAEVCAVTEPYRDTLRDVLASARKETGKAAAAARAEGFSAGNGAAAGACKPCPACASDGGAR